MLYIVNPFTSEVMPSASIDGQPINPSSIGDDAQGPAAFTALTGDTIKLGSGFRAIALGQLADVNRIDGAGATDYEVRVISRFNVLTGITLSAAGVKIGSTFLVESAPNTLAIGNGTAGDASGTLRVGNITFGADATYDIGDGAGHDPRDGHFTRNLAAGGYLAPGTKTVGTIPDNGDVPLGARYFVTDAGGGPRSFENTGVDWVDGAGVTISY